MLWSLPRDICKADEMLGCGAAKPLFALLGFLLILSLMCVTLLLAHFMFTKIEF